MDEITTEAELRELLGTPPPQVAAEDRRGLDEIDRQWLAASPFCLVATSGAGGPCDVSPKGDPPESMTPTRWAGWWWAGPARCWALAVDVEQVFYHCAKALLRSVL
ncbi:hypothetical protein [Modestobacter sp. DSM 44400]|uniref:hypothetical protein n=1 Tax=Modestobacter sp. DSM 44400 TaxID=1550230 RepID=UPI001C317E77|nr:hypothetical protein [Modestobacter sp. DSM 44400]